MAYLESGDFCSAYEYDRGMEQRVLETEIKRDEFYTLVLRLDTAQREAAKLAIRSSEIQVEKTGMAVVKFAFIDDNFEPTSEAEESMRDGIIDPVRQVIVIDRERSSEYKARGAYLKDYFEDQFGDFLAQNDMLETVH